MKKNKASFRALREDCGLTQQDIADETGVKILSVKRWENTNDDHQPPDDVWDFLLAARGALYQDAREIAEQIIQSVKAVNGKEVQLCYYRTQEQLDVVQLPDVDEPYGYANARTREIARLLEAAEVQYSYSYDN